MTSPTRPTTIRMIERTTRMSERLANAHVQPPRARVDRTVYEQPVDRCELNAEIDAKGANGREIAQAWTDVHARAQRSDVPVGRAHAARIHKEDARQFV